MLIWLVPIFRRVLTFKLRAEGYTREQRSRLASRLGDGKILEWLKKYGPYILSIILKLLPLFLMFEKPKGKKDAKVDRWLQEEFRDSPQGATPLKVPFEESIEADELFHILAGPNSHEDL